MYILYNIIIITNVCHVLFRTTNTSHLHSPLEVCAEPIVLKQSWYHTRIACIVFLKSKHILCS